MNRNQSLIFFENLRNGATVCRILNIDTRQNVYTSNQLNTNDGIDDCIIWLYENTEQTVNTAN